MTTAALVVAALSLVVVLYLAFELSKLRKVVEVVPADGGVIEGLRQIDDALRVVEDQVDDLIPRVGSLEARMPLAIKHTGVVAYDAFDDIAGNLSRSLALLNDRGDGFVISLLVGRSETRFFTKEIRGRAGSEPLSPEEEAAVAQAFAPAR